jgi:hypothetical protein
MQKNYNTRQLVGEYRINGTAEQPGLFDLTPDATVDEKPATNFEVLQMLATLGGGAIYLTDAKTPEGILYNPNLSRCEESQSYFSNAILRAVIYEQPL